MRWLAVVALVAALPALALAHGADDDDDEDGGRPNAVKLTLAGTTVRIKATFAFELDGPGVALGARTFAIPPNSVVTSGAAIVDGERHALRLEKAELADRAFDALTLKPGTRRSRAWAFVIDGSAGSVTVDVLAPKSAAIVIELTLDAPTCFSSDVRYLELPEAWLARVPATHKKIVATSNDIGHTCADDGREDTRWVGFVSRELAKQRPGQRRVGAIAGRLALGSTHFARVEIDLARELTQVPGDLHTAIVLDHSRSMTTEELESQRAIVAAYLQAAPTGRVQVIGYTRRAQPLLPSWMVASHAAPQIDRLVRALPPRNGSNVDAALREAAKWLADVRGTKRILLFSDERLAERFDESGDTLGQLIGADTLVHVVHPVAASNGIERNDDDQAPLPRLAKATQGIATFGSAADKGGVNATMLVRPISLDKLDVVAPGWEQVDSLSDRACEPILDEGLSCTWWGQGNGAAGPITITGLMWNIPFKRVVRADPTQARSLARALSVMQVLDVELQKQVDEAALAVNSMWSLFGQWGGSGGYEDVGGFGTIGTGSFSSSSHDRGFGTPGTGRGMPPLDLRGQLQPAIDRCGARDANVVIVVETTLTEIVDVRVETADVTIASCVTEAVWDTTLGLADPPARVTTRVAFAPKR
jgi:hypothetical protein